MKEQVVKPVIEVVDQVVETVLFLAAGAITSFWGKENRQFWAEGLAINALNAGSSTRLSRASMILFPKAERRDAREKIDKALISYWKKQATAS